MTYVVLGILAVYIISETIGKKLHEGFSSARRTDIGPVSEGWTHEETGWIRDLRYAESYTNVQGLDIAGDFCRAVHKNGKPETLHIACALANRDGMDTMEYHSRTVGEGFRMSRDDYWKAASGSHSTDYCRVLQDHDTGEWFAGCAVASKAGIGPREIRDTSPPEFIKKLLDAYKDVVTWYRWQDDAEDYSKKSVLEVRGNPVFPELVKPIKTRGLQLNRWPQASQEAGEAAPPLLDSLGWGEPQTLTLDQDIKPNQIRAICFWVWFDTLTDNPRVLECSNGAEDLVWIGAESGGLPIKPAPLAVQQAAEVRPEDYRVMNPESPPAISDESRAVSGTFVFEIWDKQQRLMRLKSPTATAGQWHHVAVTTTDSTTWWPTWSMWINGSRVAEKVEGRSIPAIALANNVIGKNMRGCLQDFRVYRAPMTETKIRNAMEWSKPLLHPMP